MSHIYNLKFHTGIPIGSGTDESVLVRLYSYDNENKDGDFFCDYDYINNEWDPNDHEARGAGAGFTYACKTDEFLGKINKLVVYVNPFTTNFGNCAWFLESVEVSTQMGGPDNVETWNFPCKEWIGIPERCPEKTVHRFVELTENGSKVFDHDPEGEKAELNYPIKNVLNSGDLIGANYKIKDDPYWADNIRETKRIN